MMRLVFEVPPTPVAQGSTMTGRLLAELDVETLAACELILRLPPEAFTSVEVQAEGFSQPDDTFEANVAADGTCSVAAVATSALMGTMTLLSFEAKVIGFRGERYRLTAEVVSAVGAELVSLDAESAEATILVASGAPGVATRLLYEAHVGEYYTARIVGEGGQPPYRFNIEPETLPGWLSLKEDEYLLGMPQQVGDAMLAIKVTDSTQATATQSVPLHVAARRLKISTDVLPMAAPGHPYQLTLHATGGLAPLVWEAEGLPLGLTIQGDRIQGTVDPAAALGVRAVRIRVRDQEENEQTSEVELSLRVTVALPVQEVVVSNPEALIVARDLYVAEYDIEVSAMVYSVAADMLGLEAAFELAADEILSQIFWQMEIDRQNGHITVDGGRMSQELSVLINELRELDELQGNSGVMADIRIDVEIDGKRAYTWSQSDFDQMMPRPRKAVKPIELTSEQREKLQALRKDGRRWLRYAGEQLRAALNRSAPVGKTLKQSKPEKQSPAESSPRLRDILGSCVKWLTAAKKQESLWLNVEDRAYFEQRLGQLVVLVQQDYWVMYHDALAPPPEPGSFLLTPGRHRVKVIPMIIASSTGGGIIGSVTGATLQSSVIVKFRARNPHDWPRLRGEIEISGSANGGQYLEEDVEFPQSALDIVCAGDGQLHLLPYTGDPAQPYGDPRPFSVDMGFTSKYLAADAADEFGRTWLAASDGRSVVIARNQGVGGFVKLVPPALPTPAEDITGLTVGPESFLVFLRERLAVYLNLHKVEREPAEEIDLKILNRLLRSGVAGDEPVATQAYVHRHAWRLLVANRFSSQLTDTMLTLTRDELMPSFMEGYEAPRPLRVISSIAWDDTNGEPMGVAAFRNDRRIEWFSIRPARTGQIIPPQPGPVLNLAAPPSAIYVGPGKGLTILLEPAGQLLYRETATESLHVLDFGGGITAMNGRGTILAANRKESNRVLIFECHIR